MTVNLSALGGAGQQFFDNNGNVLTGGKLWSYQAGTTTPQTTYTSASGATAHTNPIVLDSAGRVATGEIWVTAGQNYKFVLMTSANVTIATWDNITGINGTGIPSNANNVEYDPAGTGAVPTTVQSKLRETISPEDFGAVGDGVTDDTQALRNWVAANAGIHLLGGTDKTYLVNAPTTGAIILPIASGQKRNIVGNGATIKIVNNSRQYTSIFGSNTTTDDLSGLTVDGVIFDQNSANNVFPASGNVLLYGHCTVCVRNGSEINLRNNLIQNIVTTNSFYLNGNDGSGAVNVDHVYVANNRWVNVGGSGTPQDHSTIYVHGDDFIIQENYGEGAFLGATGTAAFIETHGTRQSVFDNVAKNFEGFANITGIYDGGDTENSFVTGNHGVALLEHGIRIFSSSYGAHTTGFGIIGLTVSNNRMRIRQSLLPAGSAKFYIGYGFQSGASLPVKNVQIIDNVVEYDEETVAPSYTAISYAVGANESTGTPVYENVYIGGNVIINAPASAIGLGGGGGVFKNCRIGQNTIINPGQSLYAAMGSQYKCAVFCGGNQYTGSLVIENQQITDTFAVTRMVNACYLIPGVSSTGIPCSVEMSVTLTGDKVAYSTPVKNAFSRLDVFTKTSQNKALTSTGETYQTGSEVLDTTTNTTYRIQATGPTWTDHAYDSAPPAAGVHQVGSTRINTVPTAGGNYGWVCTGAGVPGTWKTFGAIAA